MKKRIIARLDIKKNRLIKGVHLEGLRHIGEPCDFAFKYYEEGIDELLLLDSVATLHGRNALSSIIDQITKSIFIPITVGGGINSVEQARIMFNAGADKITLNSFACENPDLISKIAVIFGCQAITLSLQVKRYSNSFQVMTHNGRENSNRNLHDWVLEAQDAGIGEIMLTSIDKDGTMEGFDLDLLEYVNSFSKVPIICSGGITTAKDAKDCFELGAQAIAIGSGLHYGRVKIKNLKHQLSEANINIRFS